jgi:hypothetical protein
MTSINNLNHQHFKSQGGVINAFDPTISQEANIPPTESTFKGKEKKEKDYKITAS